ncbi:MAG: hypothetical protein KIG61_04595 [Muribaculaceae bacterium]|nr:hypothetical protein [Muribaculaceae bacterium]
MKRFLTTIFLLMIFVASSFAQTSQGNSNSQNIGMKVQNNTSGSISGINREPLNLDIEAFYDADTECINVCYTGDATGEVYLYLNETIINYSPEINASFQIIFSGLYTIEIVGDGWTATGCIQL